MAKKFNPKSNSNPGPARGTDKRSSKPAAGKSSAPGAAFYRPKDKEASKGKPVSKPESRAEQKPAYTKNSPPAAKRQDNSRQNTPARPAGKANPASQDNSAAPPDYQPRVRKSPQGVVAKRFQTKPRLKDSQKPAPHVPVTNKEIRLFISHSAKDAAVVKNFVESILKLGLGLSDRNIFCTSLNGNTIASGKDFRTAIKANLIASTAVIQIITSNYKGSEICLNEMGAAWVLSSRVIPFILPPITYDTVGFLHNTTQLLKLNEPRDLHKFRDDNKDLFPDEFNSAVYSEKVTEFLRGMR